MKIVSNHSASKSGWFGLAAGLLLVVSAVAGCSDQDNRVPTQSEVKAADVNRQAFIDKLNIPESQKAMMKSHMGGPAVSTPMDAAKGGTPSPAGKRTQ